jgi:caffeoyl-CoA O-methyltransferase
MSRRSDHLSQELNDYILAHSTPADPLLTELAEVTAARFPGDAGLQIGPEQGSFMTMLTRLSGARNAVEVGTFTGYSSICLARGLAGGGRLLCCDISEEWTSLARQYWQKAGLADRIELRLGPGLDTLRGMPPDATLDISFIDADKGGYIGYWDQIVPRTRPGGIILVDNTLFHNSVIDPDDRSANALGVRDFNDHALADDRVELVLTPIGDGLTLARKK